MPQSRCDWLLVHTCKLATYIGGESSRLCRGGLLGRCERASMAQTCVGPRQRVSKCVQLVRSLRLCGARVRGVQCWRLQIWHWAFRWRQVVQRCVPPPPGADNVRSGSSNVTAGNDWPQQGSSILEWWWVLCLEQHWLGSENNGPHITNGNTRLWGGGGWQQHNQLGRCSVNGALEARPPERRKHSQLPPHAPFTYIRTRQQHASRRSSERAPTHAHDLPRLSASRCGCRKGKPRYLTPSWLLSDILMCPKCGRPRRGGSQRLPAGRSKYKQMRRTSRYARKHQTHARARTSKYVGGPYGA